jgi:hypothetical protein
VGRTSVEVDDEAVEAVSEDPMALGKDSAALGEAAVTEATVDPASDRGGGWRGAGGGPDNGR